MTLHSDYIKAAFPNFDIENALINLGNNATLLHKVITNFFEQYNETAHNEISSLINNQQINDACQYSHTIKGLAGTIGDKNLQEHALNLESACRENDKEKINEHFNLFADQIQKSLLEIGEGLEKIAIMEAVEL